MKEHISVTDTTLIAPTSGFRRRPASFDGFVHARDARLFDGSGRELLLRGVGLGNWMLPEGYMWRFGSGAESPREIEALLDRMLGPDEATRFWDAFRDTFIAEEDIARIAASGFDHVRLPINSRVIQDDAGEPIEAGYAMIDRLIAWCRQHRLWVLLDLHGAPGGQTGTNIDDSPNGRPELFMEPSYRELTLRLWRDLATRYAGETVVLGYDLLNEPLPNEWQHTYADELASLYRELTAEIRAVDPDHLIMYEGSHWATNWGIFTEVWDENSALQFHKYWSSPDVASISTFLDARDRLGLPIYMGEGGENTVEWIYAAFRLYEAHDIGWNFWPWKKIATRTSPVSIVPPDGWDRVIAAIHDPAAIEPETARRVFAELIDAMRLEQLRLAAGRRRGSARGASVGDPRLGLRVPRSRRITWHLIRSSDLRDPRMTTPSRSPGSSPAATRPTRSSSPTDGPTAPARSSWRCSTPAIGSSSKRPE